MNMFKNLAAVAFVIFGIGLAASDPHDWHWPVIGGPHLVDFIMLCGDMKPFSYIFCAIAALALFMIRKQY